MGLGKITDLLMKKYCTVNMLRYCHLPVMWIMPGVMNAAKLCPRTMLKLQVRYLYSANRLGPNEWREEDAYL